MYSYGTYYKLNIYLCKIQVCGLYQKHTKSEPRIEPAKSESL